MHIFIALGRLGWGSRADRVATVNTRESVSRRSRDNNIIRFHSIDSAYACVCVWESVSVCVCVYAFIVPSTRAARDKHELAQYQRVCFL